MLRPTYIPGTGTALSKRKLQSQLYLPWRPIAERVCREEAAEVLRVKSPQRRIEVGVIEDVEHIGARLQVNAFPGDSEVSAEAEINLRESWSIHLIAWRSTEAELSFQIRIGVSARIDPGLHGVSMIGR